MRGVASGAGVVGLLLLLVLEAGCGDDNGASPGRETISRETFIATYVELRQAALASETGEITAEERERILGEHGVSEDDLLTFVQVHGREIEFMAGVWTEVEARLEGREDRDPEADLEADPDPADTAAGAERAPGPPRESGAG